MAPLKFNVYGELTEVKRKLILCAMYANLWRKPYVQEYLEEQLLTPIRSKVRQDVGLEEPNSRLRRRLYGRSAYKL